MGVLQSSTNQLLGSIAYATQKFSSKFSKKNPETPTTTQAETPETPAPTQAETSANGSVPVDISNEYSSLATREMPEKSAKDWTLNAQIKQGYNKFRKDFLAYLTSPHNQVMQSIANKKEV